MMIAAHKIDYRVSAPPLFINSVCVCVFTRACVCSTFLRRYDDAVDYKIKLTAAESLEHGGRITAQLTQLQTQTH